MSARRCPECLNNWPVGDSYKKCPLCEVGTNYFSSELAMADKDAKRYVAHIHFREEYAKYDRGEPSKCGRGGEVRREMRARGCASPEELGALEAREIAPAVNGRLREIRELERIWSLPHHGA